MCRQVATVDTGRSSAPAREASPVRERAVGGMLGGTDRSTLLRRHRPVGIACSAGDPRPARCPLCDGLQRTIAPSAATIRRVLNAACPGGLTDLLGHDPAGAETLAVDGKSARGSRHGASPAAHLPAAITERAESSPNCACRTRRTRSPASTSCWRLTTCPA
jgi:hypothetical protein